MGYRLNKLLTTQKFWRRKLEEREGNVAALVLLVNRLCTRNSNAIMEIVDDTEIIRTNRDRRIILLNQAISSIVYEHSHSVATLAFTKYSKVCMLFLHKASCRKRNITIDEYSMIIDHEYGHLAFVDCVERDIFYKSIVKNISSDPTLIYCKNIMKTYLYLAEESFADAYGYISGRQSDMNNMIKVLEKLRNPEDCKKYADEKKLLTFGDFLDIRIQALKKLEENEEFHQMAIMTSDKKYEKITPFISNAIYECIKERIDLRAYARSMEEKINREV